MRSVLIAASLALPATIAAADLFEVTLDGPAFVHDGQTNADIDLLINPGDTVRWTWVSGFHNVVSGVAGDDDAGSAFFSGAPTNLAGTTFEHTFTEVGIYQYFCEVHAGIGMHSEVRVVPGPGVAALLAPLGLLAARRRR